MSCINQMMQHQQIRGCQWVFSDKEHRGKIFRRTNLSSKPSLQTNPLSKFTFGHIFSWKPSDEEHWGQYSREKMPHISLGTEEVACKSSPSTKAELAGCAGRLSLCTSSFYSIHSSACSISQVTKDSRLHLTAQTAISMDTLTYTYYQIN